MFSLIKDMHVANYADDTTPYIYGEKIELKMNYIKI